MSTGDTSLVGQDLSGRDLRKHDFTGRVLFGTDLRGCRLRGAKLSLDCETFVGLKLDDDNVATLLTMLAQMDVDPQWTTGLQALIERVVGTDRAAAIARLVQVR